MKFLVGALALAILVGGLVGCRSRRAPQAAQPNTVAAQPAPQPTFPSRGPSVAPTTTYPSNSYPSSTTRVVTPAPGTARIVRPAPPRAIGPSSIGSPDAMDMAAGSGFPAPQPSYVPSQPAPVVVPPSMPVMPASSGQVDAEIARISERLRQMEDELDRQATVVERPADVASGNDRGRAAAFADQLRGQCKTGEVFQEGNVVIVRLTDAFQSGSDRLKKSTRLQTTLLNTATALSAAGAQEVLVVGHSDSDKIKKSKWPSNKALSEARARRVAQELSKQGVPACDLEVSGEGATQPLVEERTKADKAKNRRVEIHVRF